MNLDTLTLTQLFARQAQANHDHEIALAARNQHPAISAEWDLWNAVVTGSMQDLADIAAAITERIREMAAEIEVSAEAGPLTHVPMACTACGRPVMEYSEGDWMHKDAADIAACTRTGPVQARVDA